MNFSELLANLSNRRPLFHAEADFQHALAWEIHETHSNAEIRLEKPSVGRKGRIFLDLWLRLHGTRLGVELKYKTRHLKTTIGEEPYHLRTQGAHDIGRYDFLADVMRIEGLIEAGRIDHGVTIFLTNDRNYWRDTGRTNRIDEMFRVHEGRELSGELSWADHASDGTTQSRERPLQLGGEYVADWIEYSEVEGSRFRYLLLETGALDGS